MMDTTMFYLDCYRFDSINGHTLPWSYGPAPIDEINGLKKRIGHFFDRLEVTPKTKSKTPLPKENWP
jgi:hypothetical protein